MTESRYNILTALQRAEIRKRLADGGTMQALAEEFHVSRSTISRVIRPNFRGKGRPDLTGQTFGAWTVLRRSAPSARRNTGHRYWDCQCRCDRIKAVRGTVLLSGKSSLCHDCSLDALNESRRQDKERQCSPASTDAGSHATQ